MTTNERPLAVDLFCGMGGWTEGLLAAGWRVIGFDILRYPEIARIPFALARYIGEQFINGA